MSLFICISNKTSCPLITMYPGGVHNPTYSKQLPQTCPHSSALCPTFICISNKTSCPLITMYPGGVHNPTYSNQSPQTYQHSSALCPRLFAYQTKLHANPVYFYLWQQLFHQLSMPLHIFLLFQTQ